MGQTPTTAKRLSSLDYLRGLAAFGIMVFHYSMWTYGLFSSADFLGRVGIYGVAIFYVLSGLTLYHVYFDQIGPPSKRGIIQFAVKRLFRIIPLLWLLTSATLIVSKEKFSAGTIVLNYTALFSVFQWQDTICYGAWSIGNELTFYLFFPLYVFLAKRSKTLLLLCSLLTLAVYLWFACVHMDSTRTLGEYFVDYTNPLNQVFLFLSGFLIGHLAKGISISKIVGVLLVAVGVTAFTFLPVSGDSIHLVTGLNRVLFTAICILVCFACYKTEFGLPAPAHKVLHFLGEISYSLYLVHPIVWSILFPVLLKFPDVPPLIKIFIGFASSVLIAGLVYRIFERYFMRLGKHAANRLTGNQAPQ